MYKVIEEKNGKKIIIRMEDNANIPTDPENRDFKRFVEWEAKGNKPKKFDDQ